MDGTEGYEPKLTCRNEKNILSMVTRRRLLQASALLVTGLAGCGSDIDGTETATRTGTSVETETATATQTGDPNLLDIRDFGAEVNGKTDDTEAVREALDAAERGQTVFFPEGTTLVSGLGGTGLLSSIQLTDEHSGITLGGVGPGSVIKQTGGHEKNNPVLYVKGDADPKDITIRDLRIDGNRENNADRTTLGFLAWPPGDTENILVENVWVENCSATAFQASTGGVHINHCTARYNTMHGFNPDTSNPRSPIRVTNVLSHHNDNYGIDDSSGNSYIDGFVVHNCTYGVKNTRDTKKTVIKNGIIRNCETNGYTTNIPNDNWPSHRPNITIDNVLSEGHGNWAFRFSENADYDIGTITARDSNKNGSQPAQIAILDDSLVDATDIRSYQAASGAGLYYNSNRESSIQNYFHLENPAGSLAGAQVSRLEIAANHISTVEEMNALGTPDESNVGAMATQVARTEE